MEISFYQNTWRHIPEDGNRHSHSGDNLRSYFNKTWGEILLSSLQIGIGVSEEQQRQVGSSPAILLVRFLKPKHTARDTEPLLNSSGGYSQLGSHPEQHAHKGRSYF